MAEVYLTEDQFAERGHFSKRTASRMRSDGSGPPFIRATPGNIRGKVLYRESDVLAWLESRRRTSTSDPGPAPEAQPAAAPRRERGGCSPIAESPKAAPPQPAPETWPQAATLRSRRE